MESREALPCKRVQPLLSLGVRHSDVMGSCLCPPGGSEGEIRQLDQQSQARETDAASGQQVNSWGGMSWDYHISNKEPCGYL
ncbi:hypothetical protein LEMLEM_LOCUS21390, partial [Lemmus lemmus]